MQRRKPRCIQAPPGSTASIITAVRLLTGAACCLLVAGGVAACGSGNVTLGNAAVDPTHTCTAGSINAAYDIHATVDADNKTSQAIDIRSAQVVLIVADIHGAWKETVGSSYNAGQAVFTPKTVSASTRTTLKLTIPSACTNGAHKVATDYYGDYSVQIAFVTSAGTFKVTSQNLHRILAP